MPEKRRFWTLSINKGRVFIYTIQESYCFIWSHDLSWPWVAIQEQQIDFLKQIDADDEFEVHALGKK